MTLFAVAVAVSSALIAGALWGLYSHLGDRTEGFVLAAGGGALMLSAVLELIVPAQAATTLAVTASAVMLGAVTFAAVDYLIDERWGDEGGAGLLAAVTLDGVPENLALGVALIGAGLSEVGALAAAIFLSNLPEAAGGAKRMHESGWPDSRVLALWFVTLRRKPWRWSAHSPAARSSPLSPATFCSVTLRRKPWRWSSRIRRRRGHRLSRDRDLSQGLSTRPSHGGTRDRSRPPRRARPDDGVNARPADEKGPSWHHDPRLDHPVRRPQRARGQGGRCNASSTPSRPISRPARILDNYAAHKHAKVRTWLGRHERFTFHFGRPPAQCRRGLLREAFRSIVDLQFNRFLDETNDNPKPFTWTADPDKIIAAVKRGHQVLDSIH